MRITCPNCDAQYEVSDDAIPSGGRDVQCSNCNKTWYQLAAMTMQTAPAAELPAELPSGLPAELPAEPQPQPEPDAATTPTPEPATASAATETAPPESKPEADAESAQEPEHETAQDPVPEFAPEPDGSVSLDWIQSRTRLFSLSIGTSRRLAYAWLDGSDKGHAVSRFDGKHIPSRIQQGIREIVNYGHTSLRAA